MPSGDLAQPATSGESAFEASSTALVHTSREEDAGTCGGYPGRLCPDF